MDVFKKPKILQRIQRNSALDNTTDTDKTPKGNGNDTATPESTVSAGKDNEKNETEQEKINIMIYSTVYLYYKDKRIGIAR
jgi:hypothetical protein